MILRSIRLGAAALCVTTLGGCNSQAPQPQSPQPQTPASQQRYVSPITPPGFKLPDGAGCSGAVERYRAVIANDHETGNVNDSVYKQIESEISTAAAACAAGRDGEAQALVRASKSRHGYPG